MARANDLENHLISSLHVNNAENTKKSNIENFCIGKAVARVEIIWAYFAVYRNLSLQLSDFMGEYYRHMTSSSAIAENTFINRKKNQRDN